LRSIVRFVVGFIPTWGRNPTNYRFQVNKSITSRCFRHIKNYYKTVTNAAGLDVFPGYRESLLRQFDSIQPDLNQIQQKGSLCNNQSHYDGYSQGH
jgi:hypothetical protein